jgi:predicted metal-dependent peptidase
MMAKKNIKVDISKRSFLEGTNIIKEHPIFRNLAMLATFISDTSIPGYALAIKNGSIRCNDSIRAQPSQWARVLAHCLLHFSFDHFQEKNDMLCWNTACDCIVEKFLADLKFGDPVYAEGVPADAKDEETLYKLFLEEGIPPECQAFGTGGKGKRDMCFDYADGRYRIRDHIDWPKEFADALNSAVLLAVSDISEKSKKLTLAGRSRNWFISNYPLLAALASSFELIEDPLVCQRMGITTAAISPAAMEVYINPTSRLSAMECRFVLAHEFLHAALRHDVRHGWRDSYLWNVACDFVINSWLTEMGIGEPPAGILLDPQFNGLSAEAVYDQIANQMRLYKKLATLRGTGLGDIIPAPVGSFPHDCVSLDEFFRRAVAEGLSYHQEQERGYLPEGLVEEIKALGQPPIQWDVELARWFDDIFEPLRKIRSYARISRRQSSSPDIPRPSWIPSDKESRVFGVLLDASGSMDRSLLAEALGAIASYSMSRDVYAVRVVFCDAAAYDQGYMKPEDLAGAVSVKGRGGTVLQPGIDVLEKAKDFPEEAPLLIITDGWIEDRLALYGREHAFLIPVKASLPFMPQGKVFRLKE